MKQKNKSKIYSHAVYWLGVIGVGMAVGLSVQFAVAWQAPTVLAPGGNRGAPINTSDSFQTKGAGLMLNTSGASVDGLLVANGKVGIGTTTPGNNAVLTINSDSVAPLHWSLNDNPAGFLGVRAGNHALVGATGSGGGDLILRAGDRDRLVVRNNESIGWYDNGNKMVGFLGFRDGKHALVGATGSVGGDLIFRAGDRDRLVVRNNESIGWYDNGNKMVGFLGFRDGKHALVGATGSVGGDLILRAGDQDRVIVKNGGNVGIGTATPSSALNVKLDVKGDIVAGNSSNWDNRFKIGTILNSSEWSDIDGTPGPWLYFFDDINATWADGSVGVRLGNKPSAKFTVGKHSGIYGPIWCSILKQTSDRRHKKDIGTIKNAVDRIKNIRGVDFKFKDNDDPSMGVIAQEIEKDFPSLVSENENGYKVTNYSGFIGVLIEAVKDQQGQIEKLQAEVESLK